MIVSPTQSNVLAAMNQFLTAVMPPDVVIVSGQNNRVPAPKADRYIVMSPPRFRRLATNVDSSADVRFTGSIAGNTLTVAAVAFGTIQRGATVFGVGVADGTTILSPGGTGTGGTGTYPVSVAQTIGPLTLAAGLQTIMQEAEATIQLDFHASDGSAGDLAQTVTTLMRDPFATSQFASQTPNYGISPLHADDARQMPFVNDQQQVEWRWIVEAMLQSDQVLSVPQQYADSVSVEVVSVEAAYPPT